MRKRLYNETGIFTPEGAVVHDELLKVFREYVGKHPEIDLRDLTAMAPQVLGLVVSGALIRALAADAAPGE